MTAAALVMARAPQPGRVKRGLEPLLGPDGCAALQARLLARVARLAADAAPGAAYVAIDPPGAAELLGDLVGPGVALIGQPDGSPGERLAAATERILERHSGPLVTIGADTPAIGAGHFHAAAETLAGGCDAALGPALDGGVYLIALARALPELFDLPAGAWSGEGTFGLVLRAARDAGLHAGLIEPARRLRTPPDARALLDEGGLPPEVAELLQ
jgi:glycosyltransferase A (GT-A) superfamily protein (DUF2064 family)